MVLDDPFANGQTQPSPLGFAERGEWLEKLTRYLGRDPPPAVLHLGDHFFGVGLEAQRDFASSRHRLNRVVHEIEKNAAQPFRVEQQADRRRGILHFELRSFGGGFGADDLDGTIVHETIYRAAGSRSPEGLTYDELVRLIREAGRVPVERDTLYNVVREHPRAALPEAAVKVRDRKAARHLEVLS